MPPQIKPLNIRSFQTVHRNFTFGIENLFDVMNGDNPDLVGGYNETTSAIRQFLQTALDQNMPVRAVGGNWSWTTVGCTKGWLLNTLSLNRIKRMKAVELDPFTESFEQDKFLFVQCGTTVIELNEACRSLGRSLKTSGASNGQTIAGLISNCTHGSAIDIGSTPDFVVGLHIITGPDSHVYLERESRSLVTDAFIQRIGATHIRSDAQFNAALVSFGSFGFIHGVMIETAPLFLYNVHRKQYRNVDFRTLMETMDFSTADFLPRPGVRPYHFQVLVNPYDVDAGAYITTMYKREYREDYPRIVTDLTKAGPGEDAPSFIGRLTKHLPVVTKQIVNLLIKNAYAPYHDHWGTLNEIFSNTDAQGRVLSAGIGIDAKHSTAVNELLLELNETHGPFLGVYAYRFVKGTKATLGFTMIFPMVLMPYSVPG